MKNATRVFASTFGAIFALAGIEHGIGEVFQGNVAPSGIMILSWPESAFFRSLGGEPAMTIIPNLLVTGILAIFISMILLVWATLFVQRKNGGLIMMLLSIAMLVVGGGIFPPFLGIIIGVVGTKINAPLTWWRAHLPMSFRRFAGKLWGWSYIACIIAWLTMFPGLAFIGYFFRVNDPTLILVILFFALGTLPLTIFSGFANDIERQTESASGTPVSATM